MLFLSTRLVFMKTNGYDVR